MFGVWFSTFGIWWVLAIEIEDFWWVLGMWLLDFRGRLREMVVVVGRFASGGL